LKKHIFIIAALSLITFSCNVTPDSYWSGDSSFNNRYSGIKKLSDYDNDVKSWAAETQPSKYQVLVLTDIHAGAEFYQQSVEEAFFSWLEAYPELSKIKFALGLGDFAEHADENEFRRYAAIEAKINDRGIKVLNVIGNHDLYSVSGYENFKKYCYPGFSAYKFETQKLVWYGLDSASGTLGTRQLSDLRQSLPAEAKTPVIFTHVPFSSEGKAYGIMPFCLRDTTERNILISFFSRREILGYFCGHYHPGGYETFGNVTQYGLKSFGEYHKWYILDVDETSTPPVIAVREFGN
jgi:hypothetical protein